MKGQNRLKFSTLLIGLLVAFITVISILSVSIFAGFSRSKQITALADDPYHTALGTVPAEQIGKVKVFSTKPTTLADSGLNVNGNTIKIEYAVDLVTLSMLDASIYKDMDLLFDSTFNSSNNIASSFVAVTSGSDSDIGRYFFTGLGSTSNPYSGDFLIYEGGEALSLVINHALFNAVSNSFSSQVPLTVYLSQTATAYCYDENNDRIAMEWQCGYAIADYYLFVDNQNDSLIDISIIANGSERESKTMKGAIGTIQAKSGLTAADFADCTFTLKMTVTGVEHVLGTSNTGIIAGDIKAGNVYVERMQIPSNLTVSSSSGNIGGLVGSVAADVGLTINTSIDNSSVTLSVVGTGSASNVGGLVGLVTIKNKVQIPSTNIWNVALASASGKNVGGMYGKIQVSSESQPVVISLTNNLEVTLTSTVEAFGGFIGDYTSNDIKNTLELQGNPNVSIDSSYYATKVGGYIGNIAGTSYVNVVGDTSSTTILSVANTSAQHIGGVCGYINENSILDVCDFILSSNSVTANATKSCGGIVGNVANNSVVRLTGTIDLSAFKQAEAQASGVFVGVANNSLIYSDSATLTLPTTSIDEIGNYGGLIRQGASALNSVIVFTNLDNGTPVHQISVGQATDTISSKEDFARLAIYKQSEGAFGSFAGSATTINIQDSINMSGTGIWGLLRDNGSQNFAGTINGNNNTITIQPTRAIYRHTDVGLIPMVNGQTTINSLTIDGSCELHFEVNSYYGGIVSRSTAALIFNDVCCSQQIEITTTSLHVIRVGGLVGYTTGNITIASTTGALQQAEITDTKKFNTSTSTDSAHILAGVVAEINGGVAVDISGIKLGGSILATGDNANAKVGGLIAVISSSDTNASVNLNSIGFENQTVQAKGSAAVGGLFGYSWTNTDVTCSSVTTTTSTVNSTGTGIVGGMVTIATGHWQLGDGTTTVGINLSGLTYTSNNNSSTNISGLIISNGLASNSALFLEVLPNGYNCTGATVNLSSSYFDELVGNTTSTLGGANGQAIVSVATDLAHSKIDLVNCNTYKNSATYNISKSTLVNPYTRYYYNLDDYRLKQDADRTQAEKLLLWSVRKFAHSTISSYFGSGDVALTGTVNLSGYSYYPVDYSSSITLNGTSIIFDYASIATAESGNILPSDGKRQHYMMQSGLFRNASTISLSNITLSGSVGRSTGESSWKGGSGAILCGTVSGSGTGNNVAKVSLNNVTLKDLYIYGADSVTYAPLLINTAGDYTTLTLKNIQTDAAGSSYNMGEQTSAATALLGNIGFISAGLTTDYINITFSSIHLDARKTEGNPYPFGKTTKSIFSKASLMHQLVYNSNGSGQYNFSHDEDSFNGSVWSNNSKAVTYGVEISNRTSGKNQGKQLWYFESDKYVYGLNDPTDFTSGYLRYVLHVDAPDSNYHELDINLKSEDILGCGSYEDPYIIRSADQLNQIQKLLAGQVIDQMKLAVNKSNELCDKVSVHALYQSNSSGSWIVDGDTPLSLAEMRKHLQSAYYYIAQDITMDASFNGLGSIEYPFQGVIFGNTADGGVTITLEKGTAENGSGGLILCGNGCVIKDLTVDITNLTFKATQASIAANVNANLHPYYGALIGKIVGGDNIFDGVTVSGNITITGNYAKSAMIGGFVGIIEAGGIIFRGENNANSFSIKVGEEDVISNLEYVYANPFIGRVLDGFALTENASETLNGNKNYQVNYIDSAKISGNDPLTISGKIVTVHNAAGLWVLSAIINSGVASNYNIGYSKVEIKQNNVIVDYITNYRNALYNNMGQGTDTVADGDYAIAYADKHGTACPYLINKYTSGSSSFITLSQTSGVSVVFDGHGATTWYLSNYKNGYRGIGAQFYEGASGLSDSKRVLNATSIKGNNVTVDVEITLFELDKDWYHGMGVGGLFTNITAAPKFENVIISGKVMLKTQYATIGTTLEMSNNAATSTQSYYYAGGIVGRVQGDVVFDECSFHDLDVVGNISAAGFMGAATGNAYKMTATWSSTTTLRDSSFSTTVVKGGNSYSFAGGLVGRCASVLTVEMEDGNELVMDNLTFTAPHDDTKFAVNTNNVTAKVGALACQTTNCIVKNVHVTNCTYDLGFLATKNDYLGDGERDAVGGLIGFLRNESNNKVPNGTSIISGVKVENCTMNAMVVGGLVGFIFNDSVVKLNISDCSVDNVVMTGAAVGGLIGDDNGKTSPITITNCTVGKDQAVIANSLRNNPLDDFIGGFIGNSINTVIISQSSVSNFTANVYINTASGKVKGVGLIAGTLKSGMKLEDVVVCNCNVICETTNLRLNRYLGGLVGYLQNGSSLKGSNILWQDNDLNGNVNTVSVVNNDNVGVYVGTWVGRQGSGTGNVPSVQLVGVATKCTSVNKPRIDIAISGNSYISSETVVSNSNTYIVYANYTVTQPDATSVIDPHIKDYPQYPLEFDDKTVFGGDGVSFTDETKTNSILALIASDKDASTRNRYFSSLNSFVSANALFTDSVLNTYVGIQGNALTIDFPIVLIKDVSDIVNAIELLTNGGYSAALSAGKANISIQTYSYVDGAFEKYTGPAGSTVRFLNNNFSIVPGCNDSGTGKVTLITVDFKVDNDIKYSLYLPIVVDRPIEVYLSTYAALGNELILDVPSSAFNSGSVAASYGNTVSFLLEYRYYYENWEGMDLDWYFEKIIDINHELAETAIIPKGTLITLLDLNKLGSGEQYWYSAKATSNIPQLNLRTFFTNWEPVLMSDLFTTVNGVNQISVERYILLFDFPKDSTESGMSDANMRMYRNNAMECYLDNGNKTETYSNIVYVGTASVQDDGKIVKLDDNFASCILISDCQQTLTFHTHEDENANTMKSPQNAAEPTQIILEASNKITYGKTYAMRNSSTQNTFIDFVFSMQETIKDKGSSAAAICGRLTGTVEFVVKNKDGDVITLSGIPTGYDIDFQTSSMNLIIPFGDDIVSYYNAQKILNTVPDDKEVTIEATLNLRYTYDAKVKNFPESAQPDEGKLPNDYIQFICSSRLSSSDMSSGVHSKVIDEDSFYYRGIEKEMEGPELEYFLVANGSLGFGSAATNNYGVDDFSDINISTLGQLHLEKVPNTDIISTLYCRITIQEKTNSGWQDIDIEDYSKYIGLPVIHNGEISVNSDDYSWMISAEDAYSGMLSGDGRLINIPITIIAKNPARAGGTKHYTSYKVTLEIKIWDDDGIVIGKEYELADPLIYSIAKISTELFTN